MGEGLAPTRKKTEPPGKNAFRERKVVRKGTKRFGKRSSVGHTKGVPVPESPFGKSIGMLVGKGTGANPRNNPHGLWKKETGPKWLVWVKGEGANGEKRRGFRGEIRYQKKDACLPGQSTGQEKGEAEGLLGERKDASKKKSGRSPGGVGSQGGSFEGNPWRCEKKELQPQKRVVQKTKKETNLRG